MTQKFIKQIKGQDVLFCDENYYKKGKGFLTSLAKIALLDCPACLKENYASNVMHGICAWCGFDANEEEISE